MDVRPPERIRSLDAIKTYRYLRLGIIGAVVVLGVSIGIEIWKASCVQTSISAYYYTPVRAIFVGTMFTVGLALIAYKGRTWEDLWLNLAGMLAPVVAVAPTLDIGKCWSYPPIDIPTHRLPKHGEELARWVVDNIDNNLWSLWWVGLIGLGFAILIWLKNRRTRPSEIERGTTWILWITAGALALVLYLLLSHLDFVHRQAHGIAAVTFFVCLFWAIVVNARHHTGPWTSGWKVWYAGIAATMVLGFVLFFPSVLPESWGVPFPFPLELGGKYQILILEATEIVLFALYWLIQTVENWDEKVIAPEGGDSHTEIAS